MKLNEKNVASFAVCNSPVDKEGYLLKKGEVNRGYQRRWFILKGNLLFYFERRHDKEPLGVIILEGCTVELAEQHLDSYTFCINFPGQGCRSYILAANSQEEMEAWMKIITCASYDYMKLMVIELQKQLEEVNVQSTSTLQTRESSTEDVSPTQSQAKSARFNPFNNKDYKDQVTVGNTVFHVQDPELLDGTYFQGMSFEDLHDLFGQKIRQKMLEHCLTGEMGTGTVPLPTAYMT